MTESEWLACTDPEPMLAFLRNQASARKLRLFAVACSRRVWHRIDDLGRAAVEMAELFADASMTVDQLRMARLACRGAGENAAWYAAASDPWKAAGNAARSARSGAAEQMLESEAQANLLRDIMGNPFHTVAFNPSWLSSAVVSLAQSIYDEKDFARMPELAVALDSAGCQDQSILAHGRQEPLHSRGCWVMDLLLGKVGT